MMGIKIYFNDEVHRILKLPETLTALVNVIQSTFENKLPENWTLYHTDPEGITIPVSTEDQYKTIVETESAVPSSTPKFYIVPNEPIADNGTNVVNVIEEVPPQSPDLNKIVSDVAKKLGYLDIEDQNNDNVFQDEILMTKPASQNNREQMAQANDEALTSPQNMEVNPQAGPQPKDEERKNKKRLHKAKHLIKKLFYSRMPECKKNWLLEKLESIQRKLTPRQREKLQRKKESVMMKSRKKHHKREKKDKDEEEEGFHGDYHHGFRGHHGHHDHHGYHGHHGFHGYHGHHGRFGFHEYPEYDQENLRKVVLLSKQKIEENGMDLDAVNSQLPLVSTTGQMETETRVNPVNPEGKPVHTNVVCSGCGMAPIVGVRYRCSVCTYFDFCEKCEETKKHPHLFLKVREDEPKAIRAPISVGSQQDGENTIKILPAKNMMKAFKKVKKMIKAIKRGNIKKFNECHEKLFKHYPEEAKRVLETAEDWYPEGNEGLRKEWKRMKHQKGGKVRELGYWGRRRGADDWMRGEAMTSQEVERQYRFMNRSMADLHIGETPSNG